MAERSLEELEKLLEQHASGAAAGASADPEAARLKELEEQATAAGRPSILNDAAKGAASGILHDAWPATAGMFGDAQNWGKGAGLAAGGMIRGLMGKPPLTEEQIAAKEKDPYGIKAEGGVVPDIGIKMPTTEETKKEVEKIAGPEYKPVYESGKIAKNVMGFAPALMGSPLKTLPQAALKYAVIPGAASQGLQDSLEHLGAHPWVQKAGYALGGIIPSTVSARKQMFDALMSPEAIKKGKEYLGMLTSGGALAYGAHHAGVPNEALFATVFGHHIVPDTLKNIPGRIVFGGQNTKPATTNDALAIIHALQGYDDLGSSTTPRAP